MKKIIIGLLAFMSLSAFAFSKSDLYLEIESLAINCQATDNLCMGDKVLHGDSIREVELVDNTGRVVLKENAGYYRTFTRADQVSKVVSFFGEFKAGDKVLHRDSIREVELVDNTGRVVLKENANYYRTFTNNNAITMVEACN